MQQELDDEVNGKLIQHLKSESKKMSADQSKNNSDNYSEPE